MSYRTILPATYRQAPQTWKDWGGQIIEARKELAEHGHEMDAYTRNHLEYQIKQMMEAHAPAVINGMLEELNGAITGYQAAQAKMVEARQAEIKGWDTGKLGAEMNLATAMIGMVMKQKNDAFRGGPTVAQRMEAIWQDALLSQDKHKIRAVAEVFQSIRDSALDHDTNLAANIIASQASAKLAELRDNTPEIRTAAAGIAEARNWLAEVYRAERQGMIDLGEGDPAGLFAGGEMGKAFRRIRTDRQTGQVTILAEDDPDVQGFSLPDVGGSEGSNE